MNMGHTIHNATARSSAPYSRINTSNALAASEGNLHTEMVERQRLFGRFNELVNEQEVQYMVPHRESDLKSMRTCSQRVVEDANFPFRYFDPVDTLARHGRGSPEPYYAYTMDTYGPTISNTIGQIRDARTEEFGELKGARERLRNDMYSVSAFAPELLEQNSGDPLGLTSPAYSSIRSMADVEVRQREERKMLLEMAAAREAFSATPAHTDGRVGSSSPGFHVQPHVRTKPPPPVPCAW